MSANQPRRLVLSPRLTQSVSTRATLGAALFLSLGIGFGAVALAATDEARITADERAGAGRLLDESETALLTKIVGLRPDQWIWKPAPDRWSIAECTEHIVRTESSLFATAKQALAQPVDPEWKNKTAGKAEFLRQAMPNRTTRAQAPQEVRPQGGKQRDELLADFFAHRLELRGVLGEDRDFKAHVVTHPFPIFGDLNAFDWILYVPLHTIRHSKQIQEVLDTPGFPK